MRLNVIAFFLPDSQAMGGDTRIAIELIKFALNHKLFKEVRIFTTAQGKKTFQSNGVKGAKFEQIDLNYSPLSLIAHIKYIYQCIQFVRKFDFNKKDLVLTRSHFWPEVLPSLFLKIMRRTKWIAGMYLFYPLPWKGFLHSYDTKVVFPSVGEIWKFAYNRFSFFLFRSADLYVITNDSDRTYFHHIPKKTILAIYGGVNYKDARAIKNSKREKYDGIFVGRLHQQKGIEYLIKIWSLIVEQSPKAKLGIIGVGDHAYVKQMKKLTRELKLENNVDWLGYVDGKNKYKILKQSRVFLHTTIYDNNGMAAAEALAASVPVVRFDLPPLQHIYQEGCLVAKKNNLYDFAFKTYRLLIDDRLYGKLRKEASRSGKKWDWEYKGNEFEKFLKINGIL